MQLPIAFLIALEDEWGTRPLLTVACAGGSDQHIQVWHGDALFDHVGPEEPMPAYVITETVDGPHIAIHPNADPDHIEFVWDGEALVPRT